MLSPHRWPLPAWWYFPRQMLRANGAVNHKEAWDHPLKKIWGRKAALCPAEPRMEIRGFCLSAVCGTLAGATSNSRIFLRRITSAGNLLGLVRCSEKQLGGADGGTRGRPRRMRLGARWHKEKVCSRNEVRAPILLTQVFIVLFW